MGKMVQIKSGYTDISLPPSQVLFDAGEIATLTDAEYAGLPVSKRTALTVVASGLADPFRLNANPGPQSLGDAVRLSKQYTDSALRSLNPQASLEAAKQYTDQQVATVATGAVHMLDRLSARPSTGTVIWTGGTSNTPPPNALSGDLWIRDSN